MKLEFVKNQLPILAALVVVIGVIAGIYYFTQSSESKPITKYKFQGNELSFRDDLRLAKNISVYPDEQAILNKIWSPEIQNITIVYKDTSDNQFTTVNAFEITFKLRVAYGQFSWDINFDGKEVESFDNLNGSVENLIVALIPPSLATDTGVEMKDHVVYIKGKTQKEFDLATIKFIMAALNITI